MRQSTIKALTLTTFTIALHIRLTVREIGLAPWNTKKKVVIVRRIRHQGSGGSIKKKKGKGSHPIIYSSPWQQSKNQFHRWYDEIDNKIEKLQCHFYWQQFNQKGGSQDKRWEDKDETRRVKIFRQWSGRDCFTYVQIDFLALAQTGFDIDRRRSQTLWYRAVVQYKWATKDNIITLFAPFFYMRHDLLPTLCLQAQIHVHKQKKEEENVSQGWRKVCIIIFSSYFTPKLTWWCNPYLEDSLHLVVVLPFAYKLLH